MKIKPCGYYILVEVEPIETHYKNSTIAMPEVEAKKEHGGREIGKILAFGPKCFKGFDGCEGPEDWGCAVGDSVEFNRYDGKKPAFADTNGEFDNFRLINDSDIIAVLEES